MNWLEIFIALGGTATIIAALTFIVTVRYIKRKESATAGQEEAKEKQEVIKSKKDLADLERDIYERIVATLQEQFDKQNMKINDQDIEIKDLKFANEIQKGNIAALEKTVSDYKATCDNCQIRIEKIKTNLSK